MAAIKTGLRLRFGSATTKNKDGFCRFCVSGGIHIPGRKQVKFIESVSKTPEWEKFSNPSNKYGKCKRNSDCMSNMCYGNNFGLNQGYCAPYKLPLGSPCFYKQSCGVAEYNSKCVGNAFGRQGVCWWKDATKMESCTSDPKNSKKGGCECSGDKQCHSKLCLGGWWGAFGSVGVCQTAPKPKKGAQVGDLDHGDAPPSESCTARKDRNSCMHEQSKAGGKVKCTWCSKNNHYDKCRKSPSFITCSSPLKCPEEKKYDKKTKTCLSL